MTIKEILFTEMIDCINEQGFLFFCDFLDYCDSHNKDWFETLIDNESICASISAYLESKLEKAGYPI